MVRPNYINNTVSGGSVTQTAEGSYDLAVLDVGADGTTYC